MDDLTHEVVVCQRFPTFHNPYNTGLYVEKSQDKRGVSETKY